MTQKNTNDIIDMIKQEHFADLIEEYLNHDSQEGTVHKAKVVSVDTHKNYVIVDVGLKSECKIPLSEFKIGDNEIPQIGDIVEVYIENFEGKNGLTIASRERAVRNDAWHKFKLLHEQSAIVEGVIIGQVRGGFAVDLKGLVAFLPGSQVDIKPVTDMNSLLHTVQTFKILSCG